MATPDGWAKEGEWEVYRNRAREVRALRWDGLEVTKIDGARSHRVAFATASTRDTWLRRARTTLHRRSFHHVANERRSPGLDAARAAVGQARTPAPSTKTKRRPKLQAKSAPRRRKATGADVIAVLSRLRQLVPRGKVARRPPARPAILASASRVLGGSIPPSVAEVYAALDGFSVEARWAGRTIIFELMSLPKALRAWKESQAFWKKAPADIYSANARAELTAILPLVAQYDGSLLGLDTRRRGRDREIAVVYWSRNEDHARVVAPSLGAFLGEVLAHGFSPPSVPDVANRAGRALGQELARARTLRGRVELEK